MLLSDMGAGSYSLLARAVYDTGSTGNSAPATICVRVMGLYAPGQKADTGGVGAGSTAKGASGI